MESRDPAERAALIALSARTAELRRELDDRHALLIINRLAESLNGGKGG